MARTPKPTDSRSNLDPEPTIDVSSLPVAELHELETFEEPTNSLKAAAAIVNAMAETAAAQGSDEPAPKREADGPPLKEVAEQKANSNPLDPVQKVPGWAKIPEGEFRFPKHRHITFVRLRKEWTDTPGLGDRVLILWSLSPGDEQFALKRAQGDHNRVTAEMVKQTIRAIDGQVADWAGTSQASPDVLWGQIGKKCRELLLKIYLQVNTLNAKEMRDFLETCLAVVAVG